MDELVALFHVVVVFDLVLCTRLGEDLDGVCRDFILGAIALLDLGGFLGGFLGAAIAVLDLGAVVEADVPVATLVPTLHVLGTLVACPDVVWFVGQGPHCREDPLAASVSIFRKSSQKFFNNHTTQKFGKFLIFQTS